MSSRFKRHALVRLTTAGWEQAIAGVAPELHSVVQDWRQHDWPAVVRRRDADASEDELCLGIALPPDADGNKLRIALRVAQVHVREMRAPLTLHEVMTQAPSQWRAALEKLQHEALVQALDMRVYGSLALQALTGMNYLRPDSDIDLLFSPLDEPQLVAGIQLLARTAHTLPLDGEVQFPDGAVAWKEWQQVTAAAGAGRVLLKRTQDVALLLAADVVAAFSQGASLATAQAMPELPVCPL